MRKSVFGYVAAFVMTLSAILLLSNKKRDKQEYNIQRMTLSSTGQLIQPMTLSRTGQLFTSNKGRD